MMMVRPLGRTLVVIFCSKLLTSWAQAPWPRITAASRARANLQLRKKVVIHAPDRKTRQLSSSSSKLFCRAKGVKRRSSQVVSHESGFERDSGCLRILHWVVTD